MDSARYAYIFVHAYAQNNDKVKEAINWRVENEREESWEGLEGGKRVM